MNVIYSRIWHVMSNTLSSFKTDELTRRNIFCFFGRMASTSSRSSGWEHLVTARATQVKSVQWKQLTMMDRRNISHGHFDKRRSVSTMTTNWTDSSIAACVLQAHSSSPLYLKIINIIIRSLSVAGPAEFDGLVKHKKCYTGCLRFTAL